MPPLEQPVMRTTVLAVSDMLPQMNLDGKVVLCVCLDEGLYKYLESARITSLRSTGSVGPGQSWAVTRVQLRSDCRATRSETGTATEEMEVSTAIAIMPP